MMQIALTVKHLRLHACFELVEFIYKKHLYKKLL